MHVIPNKVDFYITNVCNLTCDNCNRFNNYDFKGWQSWNDYQEDYVRWGRLVELKAITIMGGEPFLNPTLKDWVAGLNKIFNIEVQILTNGTRFLQAKNVYDSLLYSSPTTRAKNHIGVSLHNMDDWPMIRDSIHEFLQGPVREYPKAHRLNYWNSDWHFVDKNGIQINVYISNHFGKSAISVNQYQRFVLHNNDIEQAYQNCSFAQFKSYHFIRGKLYKCGPVALMPEFDRQHQFDISESDRALLNSYKPLSPDNFEQYHQEFFQNLDQPISQCKFCPTKFDRQPIQPLRKGL